MVSSFIFFFFLQNALCIVYFINGFMNSVSFSLSLAFHLNAIQEPQDLATANLIINELRSKCRLQAEQILAWKKAYTYEVRIRLMLQ